MVAFHSCVSKKYILDQINGWESEVQGLEKIVTQMMIGNRVLRYKLIEIMLLSFFLMEISEITA